MAIEFFEQNKMFLLQTKNSTYAFCIETDRTLGHRFWGGRVFEPCDVPSRYGVQARNTKPDDNQEYRAFGGQSLLTPAVKVSLPDGNSTLTTVRTKDYGTFTGAGLMKAGICHCEIIGHANSQILIVDEVD